MEIRHEVRNEDGKLMCILKKNEAGTFCETKGKHINVMSLDGLKKIIIEFEESVE